MIERDCIAETKSSDDVSHYAEVSEVAGSISDAVSLSVFDLGGFEMSKLFLKPEDGLTFEKILGELVEKNVCLKGISAEIAATSIKKNPFSAEMLEVNFEFAWKDLEKEMLEMDKEDLLFKLFNISFVFFTSIREIAKIDDLFERHFRDSVDALKMIIVMLDYNFEDFFIYVSDFLSRAKRKSESATSINGGVQKSDMSLFNDVESYFIKTISKSFEELKIQYNEKMISQNLKR